MKRNFFLYYKLENKTLSEKLQDYKVKYVFETERFQDKVYNGKVIRLQERKDNKSLSQGEGKAVFFEPLFWTLIL